MSNKKGLNILDLILFTVCGIVVLDTVAASAAIGVQSITWWIISVILFFIPYGLVTAELGSSWPEEGGIYVWVKEAMGDFWGTLVSWFYWINVAYWMPSVFVLFSGILASVFFPGLSNFWQAVIGIILTWITVAIGIADINVGKWFPNVGGVIKTFLLLFLGFIGIKYALTHGPANSFAAGNWSISWSTTLAFAPVIVYNYMGFELMSSASHEMENPQKDVPKAILIGGIIIAFVYIFSTFGILSALPVEDVNIVTGVTDAFQMMIVDAFGESANWLYYALSVLVLYTFLANMITWSIGGNRVIAATGLDEKAPAVLGHKHEKYGTPDYAYYIMGVISTVLIIGNYIGVQDVQNVFWALFALSSIVFLLPYLFMFPVIIILRKKYPDKERPFTVPGGRLGLWLSAILGEFFILLACIFFFLPPEGTESIFRYEVQLIGGTIITALIGIYLYYRSVKKSEQNSGIKA